MPTYRQSLSLLLVSLVPMAAAAGCGSDGSIFDQDGNSPGSSSGASSGSLIGGDSGGPGGDGGGTSNGGPVLGCGNAFVDPGERCDDGNAIAGDGCSADCLAVEEGYLCPKAGAVCITRCGDGVLKGDEACDDANTVSGDGCSDSCQFETGYACDVPGAACVPTVCGDGVVKGLEQCDDGNTLPYDGCFACSFEPVCNGQGCTGVCGDGVIYPGEQCDDGNRRSGDGCSATCTNELGFTIVTETEAPPAQLVLPTLYRDFKSPYAPNASASVGYGEATNTTGHPDFERFLGTKFPGSVPNLVEARLGADGKPAYNGPANAALCAPGDQYQACQFMTGATEFFEWYHDDNGLAANAGRIQRSMAVVSNLTLAPVANQPGTYRFDGSQAPYAPFSFFPLDEAGFGVEQGKVCRADLRTVGGTGFRPVECFGYQQNLQNAENPYGFTTVKHNFHFTTELHNVFTYVDPGNDTDGPVLEFSGDDDVWIFINGRRVVDLGGLHPIETSSYKLTRARAAELELTVGGVYDVALFHAERRSSASNFKFTLGGFVKAKTVATPICGDGIKTQTETCDDGANTGGYGQCAPGCVWGPRCGDGIVQPEFEQCDDQNLESEDGCTPRCQNGDRDPVN